MKRYFFFRAAGRCLPAVAASLLAGGCGSLLVATYGHGRVPQSPDLEIVMPQGAPSITQAFRSLSSVPDRDPTGEHDGIDIIAPAGTPVIAAAPGKVVRSHLTVLRGNRVVIEHDLNDKGELVRTEYVHLKKRRVVAGDLVGRGDQVGDLGMTGITAGYPHLHFMVTVAAEGEVPERSRAVDPHLYWARGEGRVTCLDDTVSYRGSPPALTYPLRCP